MVYDWLVPILGAAAANVGRWVGGRLAFLRRPRIRITTTPPPGGIPVPAKRYGDGGFVYDIAGTVSRIRAGTELWILTQSLESGEVWPQDQPSVRVNPKTGEWSARVYLYPGMTGLRILAVLAPSTSQQLFRYYHRVLRALHDVSQGKGHAIPLNDVPKECVVRDDIQLSVQAE